MGELNVGVCFQEILQTLPAAICFLDFLTTSTNRQQAAEIAEIAMGDFQFALGEKNR